MPQSIVQYDKTLPYIEDTIRGSASELSEKETTNEYELVPGRRPSKMLLVNKLRSEVDKWRMMAIPELQPLLRNFWRLVRPVAPACFWQRTVPFLFLPA